LPIAKEADFIFTTAVEMVPRYIADTGNHRVYFQPYGVNPAIHNPIGFMKRRSMDLYRDSVFFAGSWYGSFKNRCDDTSRIFDGVIEGGKDLIVADRSLDYARRDGRIFPSKYNEYIIPPLDHAVLQKVHKLFDFAINLNSVTDSETMGAMRVLEVQALGSLLISNYSKSLENFYPDVCVVREKEDAGEYLAALDEKEIVRRQIAGIRRMFSEATVYDRLNLMLLRIGYPRLFEDKTVYVLYEDLTESIESQFCAQRYRKKELVSLSEFQERGIRDGYAVLLRDGGCLDEYFLVDAVNAFKFTDVSYVAAVAIDDYGTGYDYATGAQGKFDTLYALDKVTLDGNGIEGLAGDGELDGFLIAL
jgi:hypothetical protein